MLIILCGLPGTGKTTISKAVARHIGAVHIRVDSIETGLKNSTLQIDPIEDAGYMAAFAVALDNLRLGHAVIADSVNPIPLTQQAWKEVGERANVACVEVEFACTDAKEHRARIEDRKPDLPNHTLPSWDQVQSRDYQAPRNSDIVIETSGKTLNACVDEFLNQLERFIDVADR